LLIRIDCFKATCVLPESLSGDHVRLTAYNLEIVSSGPKSTIIFIQMSQGLRLLASLDRACRDHVPTFSRASTRQPPALWLAARNQETNADDCVEEVLRKDFAKRLPDIRFGCVAHVEHPRVAERSGTVSRSQATMNCSVIALPTQSISVWRESHDSGSSWFGSCGFRLSPS
jgi:hypothetical protein